MGANFNGDGSFNGADLEYLGPESGGGFYPGGDCGCESGCCGCISAICAFLAFVAIFSLIVTVLTA